MKRLAVLVLAGLLLAGESFADAKAGEKKAQLCLLCHKVANAIAPGSAMPLLEAQPARYLYLQTRAYKEKQRAEPAMQTNVATLTDRDLRNIADWLAAQRPPRPAYQLDPARVAAGKSKAEQLGCAACHLPTFHGAGEMPRLAGQTPGYLRAQLEDFGRGKRRHGTGQRSAPTISLDDREAEDLAQFLASLE